MGILIEKATPDQLVLKKSPVLIYTLGGVFLVLAVGITYLASNQYIFECVRTPVEAAGCTITKAGLISPAKITDVPIVSRRKAEVETSYNWNRNNYTYRVEINTAGSVYPLTESYSSGYQRKEKVVEEINIFINDISRTHLKVVQDDRIVGVSFGIIFFLISLGLILIGQRTVIILNLPNQLLYIQRRSFIGKKNTEIPLTNIRHVELEESKASKTSTSYRIAFCLKDGASIPLTSYYSSGYGDKKMIVDYIQKYLDYFGAQMAIRRQLRALLKYRINSLKKKSSNTPLFHPPSALHDNTEKIEDRNNWW